MQEIAQGVVMHYVYRMYSRQSGDARAGVGRRLRVSTRILIDNNMGGIATEPSHGTVDESYYLRCQVNALRSYGDGTRRATGPP